MPIRTTTITRADRLRLVGESLVDERSVSAAYMGRPLRATTYERIARAAQALGLPPPPPSPRAA